MSRLLFLQWLPNRSHSHNPPQLKISQDRYNYCCPRGTRYQALTIVLDLILHLFTTQAWTLLERHKYDSYDLQEPQHPLKPEDADSREHLRKTEWKASPFTWLCTLKQQCWDWGRQDSLTIRTRGPELSLQFPHENKRSLPICNTCVSSLTSLQRTEK